MDTLDDSKKDKSLDNGVVQKYFLETEAYIGLLVLIYLYDQKAVDHVRIETFSYAPPL